MEPDFTFGPSGSVALFNAGVAYYIRKYFNIAYEKATVYCISGGACGLVLLTGKNPEDILARATKSAEIMGKMKNEKFPPAVMEDYCRRSLDALFDDDAHKVIGNRVSFGTTNILTGKPVVVSSPFETKEAFINAMLASAYIPFFFLRLPYKEYPGLSDGGFSHTICPYSTPDTIRVCANMSPIVDLAYKESRVSNLDIKDTKQLMDCFWKGVEVCRENHHLIRTKLLKLKLMRYSR